MDRLTNKNVDVKPNCGALGEGGAYTIRNSAPEFLEDLLNDAKRTWVGENALRDVVRELYAALKQHEDAEERGGWISVKDRLPDEGMHVLVLFDTGGCTTQDVAYYINHNGGYWNNDWNADISNLGLRDDITHWQPLPDPPKTNA